jgi:hypothetical protein
MDAFVRTLAAALVASGIGDIVQSFFGQRGVRFSLDGPSGGPG